MRTTRVREMLARFTPRATVVVVAPHPDDDILGCGAFVACAAAAGSRIVPVYVTDGSASHPGSRAYPPARVREVRAEEAVRANARLGVDEPPHFLGFPDGTLDRIALVDVARALASCIPNESDVLVLGPWRRDPHPDHRFTAESLRLVASARPDVSFADYFVWLGERGDSTDEPRENEGRILTLSTRDGLARKAAALAEHRSQLGGMIVDANVDFRLPEHLVASALGPTERFLVWQA